MFEKFERFEMFERFERGLRPLAFVLCLLSFVLSPFLAPSLLADTSEIKVNLKLDSSDYVVGERIRGVVDIANPSPDRISVGYSNSKDLFFIEVFRASDMTQLSRTSKHPFVARFRIDSSEGQKLETLIGDHYSLREPSRYLAKPVLVHRGMRYEGAARAFDVVDGIRQISATQLFKTRPGLRREFSIVSWSRGHSEHLFLMVRDAGTSTRSWETRDLGANLRLERPTISVMPTGEVIILHRLNQDQFVRSEFWSLPDALEYRGRETVRDPETAGTARVRELYKEGGVKAKDNPWWKFW